MKHLVITVILFIIVGLSAGCATTDIARPTPSPPITVYTVDPNMPPQMTINEAHSLIIKVMPNTIKYYQSYKDFYADDKKISLISFRYKGNTLEYESLQQRIIPYETISTQVERNNDSGFYYVKAPYIIRNLLLKLPQEEYIYHGSWVWENIEDIRNFVDAVYVMQQAMAGKAPFSYIEHGRKYLETGDKETARQDAMRHIQDNPRLQVAFNEENTLELYDTERINQQIISDSVAVENAEKKGDASLVFNAYLRLYALIADNDPRLQEIKEGLIRLYSKLSTKPGLPEAVRRLRVKAEVLIKDMKYEEGLRRIAEVLDIVPWWPEGYYNSAVLSEELNDYAGAIKYMKVFLQLAPDSPNARAGQDKIYEWEDKTQRSTQ